MKKDNLDLNDMNKDNMNNKDVPEMSTINDVVQWFIDKLPEPTFEDVDTYGDSNASIGEGLFDKYWSMLSEKLGDRIMTYSGEIRQQIKSAVLKGYNITLDELRDKASQLDLEFKEYLAIVNYVKALRTSEGVMSKEEHEQLLNCMSQEKHKHLLSALAKLIKE